MADLASDLKVAAYIHLTRASGNATGVGRHIGQMIRMMDKEPGVNLKLMAPRNELNPDGTAPGEHPFGRSRFIGLPLSRGMMERMWWLFHRPRAEFWCPGIDWVYCPADSYVPVKTAKLAVTIHDIEGFETDLPWSNTPGHAKRRRRWGMKLPLMYRESRLILTVSEFSRRRMQELLNWDPAKIVVVGNGVDERFFSASEQVHERLVEGPYLVTVGGLTERKGAKWTLEVARELARRKSNLKLVVCGKSEAQFAEQAKEIANIVQLGFVKDVDLPGVLRHATALLFLSRYEGFGMPILEAMACGTPAIVAEFASLPEIAGEAGIVADVTKPGAIADLVMQFEKDGAMRERYSRMGIERARGFTWKACVDRLVGAMKAAG
jgi:glycosyltransferase involved in cell wall biosynthesis